MDALTPTPGFHQETPGAMALYHIPICINVNQSLKLIFYANQGKGMAADLLKTWPDLQTSNCFQSVPTTNKPYPALMVPQQNPPKTIGLNSNNLHVMDFIHSPATS